MEVKNLSFLLLRVVVVYRVSCVACKKRIRFPQTFPRIVISFWFCKIGAVYVKPWAAADRLIPRFSSSERVIDARQWLRRNCAVFIRSATRRRTVCATDPPPTGYDDLVASQSLCACAARG